MQKGTIINGELILAPDSVKFGTDELTIHNEYYDQLGFKWVRKDTAPQSPFCDYDITAPTDMGDHILLKNVATLKSEEAIKIARKEQIVTRIREMYDADDVEAILQKALANPSDTSAQAELSEYHLFTNGIKNEVDAEIEAIKLQFSSI